MFELLADHNQDILKDYPCLEDEDITVALEYAARQTDHRILLSA